MYVSVNRVSEYFHRLIKDCSKCCCITLTLLNTTNSEIKDSECAAAQNVCIDFIIWAPRIINFYFPFPVFPEVTISKDQSKYWSKLWSLKTQRTAYISTQKINYYVWNPYLRFLANSIVNVLQNSRNRACIVSFRDCFKIWIRRHSFLTTGRN